MAKNDKPEAIDPRWAWQRYRPSAESPWDIKKVGHLFRLDILPCCFEDRLFQAGTALLDSPTARITNEDHDVSQNATSPLLNEGSHPRTSLDLAAGQMGVLTEWEEQLNGGKQTI